MRLTKAKPKYLKKKKRRRIRPFVLLFLIILLSAGGFFTWKYILQNIKTDLTIEVNGTVRAEDFMIREYPLPIELESDPSTLDLTQPGDHTLAIRYCWLSYKSTLHVRDTVAPTGTAQNLTVLAPHIPSAEDFVTECQDMTNIRISYASQPDPNREGDQTITIVLTDQGGNKTELQATLTIQFDTTAPEITGVTKQTVYTTHSFNPLEGVTVTDDYDAAPVLSVDDSNLDLSSEGTYELTYTAVDASGNVSSTTALITVVHDEEAPVLQGVRPLSVYAESTISYRSNVIVTDNKDPAPILTIDSSQVDLTSPGTYPVVYQATDAAGNETILETTITVGEKPDDLVDADTIYAEADKLIARIITDDMTVRQQVKAIYVWVLNNCWYTNDTDKTDYMQTAYHMMTKGNGDCFGFYSVTRLLFERLNIPNLTIQRMENSYRRSTHYWSMVSVDGGKTYYHFDSCPHPEPAYAMCLVTDARLEWFNKQNPYYYHYDKSLYPATPEA